MKKNKLLSCILGVIFVLSMTLFSISLSRPEYEVIVSSTDVNLGTFNALLTKETVVTLENKGKNTFVIDSIIADCGCIGVKVESDKIDSGKKMDMKIQARQAKDGKLSHEIVIVPKDKENYEPIKINVTGNVIEPISVKAGWLDSEMVNYDPNDFLELDIIHRSLAKPVLSIDSKVEDLDLRNIIPDIHSSRFELDSYEVEKVPIASHNHNVERLIIKLRPKENIKTGLLQEIIQAKLKDNAVLYLPIKSRIVGDAYVVEQRISFDSLAMSEQQEVKVHFTNNTKPWINMKWGIEGDLSDVIKVSINKNKSTDTCIVADLIVKQDLLERVPKGYNFSRLKFYQNGLEDEDVVSVLIDGYN